MNRTRQSLPLGVLIAAVAVWAAVLPVPGVGATPAQAGPTLIAGPAEGLGDGQEITVTGAGFAPGRELTIYQCQVPDFLGLVDCDLGTAHRARTAADGSLSTRLRVHAVIDTWGTATGAFDPGAGEGIDCRQPGACALATEISFRDVGAAVIAPLAFDSAAEEHLPAITVSPDDGLIDRQHVRVEGQGFLRGERPFVRIYQCGTSPEWGRLCRPGPNQTAELDEEGGFAANLPVSARPGDGWDTFDCRTAGAACYLQVVVAGRNRTQRTTARAPLAFEPDAPIPDWRRPQVRVTPTRDLGRVQEVAVRGTGFTPGGTVSIWQCPAEGPRECANPLVMPTADARGRIDTEVAVQSSFEANAPPEVPSHMDCREAPGCVLRVRDTERGIALSKPLRFAAPEPGRRYLDPVFDEVDADHDVVYRTTTDAGGNPVQLELDIYRPRGDTAARRPATVWMHGGFFRSGDKSAMEAAATESARYGQVGISIDYRLRPDATTWRDMYLASLDAYDDATAAIEWLRQHADEYGIDPDAIVAGGFSAGAVTALNLAYLPGQRGPDRSLIAAAIPSAGHAYTPPERGEPPTIAFHGTNDGILPYDNLATLCPHAAAVDVPCELVTYDGEGHGVGTLEDRMWRSSAFVAEHVLEPLGYVGRRPSAGPS